MKKSLLILLVLVSAMAFVGCNSAPAESKAGDTNAAPTAEGKGSETSTSEMTPGPAANENRVGSQSGGN